MAGEASSRERPPGPGRNCFRRWGRGGRRESAGGRSTWQEEMTTLLRSTAKPTVSTTTNVGSLFGDQSLRAGGTALLAAAAGGQRGAQEAKVVAAAPSDE